MPWILFALLGGAGALYYGANKKPTSARYQLQFGAADTPATFGLLQVALMNVSPQSTVVNQGGGDYLITVPYQFDLMHALPPELVPHASAALPSISGDLDSIDGGRTKRYTMQVSDDRFEGGAQFPRNRQTREVVGCCIAGHRWNGHSLV